MSLVTFPFPLPVCGITPPEAERSWFCFAAEVDLTFSVSEGCCGCKEGIRISASWDLKVAKSCFILESYFLENHEDLESALSVSLFHTHTISHPAQSHFKHLAGISDPPGPCMQFSGPHFPSSSSLSLPLLFGSPVWPVICLGAFFSSQFPLRWGMDTLIHWVGFVEPKGILSLIYSPFPLSFFFFLFFPALSVCQPMYLPAIRARVSYF